MLVKNATSQTKCGVTKEARELPSRRAERRRSAHAIFLAVRYILYAITHWSNPTQSVSFWCSTGPICVFCVLESKHIPCNGSTAHHVRAGVDWRLHLKTHSTTQPTQPQFHTQHVCHWCCVLNQSLRVSVSHISHWQETWVQRPMMQWATLTLSQEWVERVGCMVGSDSLWSWWCVIVMVFAYVYVSKRVLYTKKIPVQFFINL